MIHEKKVLVPAFERTEVEYYTCDICKEEIEDIKSSYDVSETSIWYRFGEEYPEFSETTEIEFDICAKCFINKLVPWIESHGSKRRVTVQVY